MVREYSIKDIADTLWVSKTTVRKIIQRENIEFDCIKNNKQLYSEEKARQIIKAIKPDFEFANSKLETENIIPETENQEPKVEEVCENSQTETANSQSAEMLVLKQAIDLLGKQLEEKDRQLKQKDKQIDDLNDRLKEAMELTHAQQYISATEKTTKLLEEQTASAEEVIEPVVKKSLFAKLFNK